MSQYVLSTWEGSLIMLHVPVLVSQEGRCLFFFNGHSLWSASPFLQYLQQIYNTHLVGHKKTSSSYHKIQVISCVSLNDFPRPQYVTISSITMDRHN